MTDRVARHAPVQTRHLCLEATDGKGINADRCYEYTNNSRPLSFHSRHTHSLLRGQFQHRSKVPPGRICKDERLYQNAARSTICILETLTRTRTSPSTEEQRHRSYYVFKRACLEVENSMHCMHIRCYGSKVLFAVGTVERGL